MSRREAQEHGGDAEPHGLGWITCAICREGNMFEDGESDTRELDDVEEGQISERRESDVGDARMGSRRGAGVRIGRQAPRGRRVEA